MFFAIFLGNNLISTSIVSYFSGGGGAGGPGHDGKLISHSCEYEQGGRGGDGIYLGDLGELVLVYFDIFVDHSF